MREVKRLITLQIWMERGTMMHEMPDLSTTFLGLALKNPLVASASPLSKSVDTVRRLKDAGAAAVVMYSLFEEEITHESFELDHYLDAGAHSYAESMSYFPDLETYSVGPERYLEHVSQLKAAVDIPIIGSLNGVSTGGWVEYARRIEAAGADALELNIYYLPARLDLTAAEVENEYIALIQDVCAEVRAPVAVKLSPYFTALPNFALRCVEAGAQGLVFFNRFYQPDFDLETLSVTPNLQLSASEELRLRLRWVAMLYGRLIADLAITGGVHTGEDAVKAVMSGANVAMMASELLAHGPERVAGVLAELTAWMREHEYESVTQMRGCMSQRAIADPGAFERANYMKTLGSYRQ
jgi:dihydroorotate dehydrogenase (fumarate)